MHFYPIEHTTNPTPSDSVIQVSGVPDLSTLLLQGGTN